LGKKTSDVQADTASKVNVQVQRVVMRALVGLVVFFSCIFAFF